MEHYTYTKRTWKPVCADGLSTKDGRFIYVSRQSSPTNSHGHDRYEPMLAEEHARLSPDEPFFMHRFTGCGSVSILHEAFYEAFYYGDVESVLEGTYFGWLGDLLRCELSVTSGRKLYVVFPCEDRMLRPARYAPKGKGTDSWHCTEEDFAVFQRFLDHYLGERASDVMLAVIDDSDPKKSRSNAIRLGQASTGRRGGRPKKQDIPLDPKAEAIRLARGKGWNAGQVRRHLWNLRNKTSPSIRVIQVWLKNEGLESRPGRPKEEN